MTQGTLFNYETTKTKFDIQKEKELPWYEDTICKNLEFIVVPYALLFGSMFPHAPRLQMHERSKLIEELFSPIDGRQANVEFEIEAYLTEESRWLRRDHTKRLRNNRIDANEFANMLAYGTIELKKRHTSLADFKKLLRHHLPISQHVMKFSRLGRYILNGRADEHWYQSAADDIKNLFPQFDQELVTSLLAITSIRNDLKGNITKFFKVLHQFFEEKTRVVKVGQKGQKTDKVSMFEGVIDAAGVNLDLLKKGESLINSDRKNAAKIRRFARAMNGIIDAIVADIWIVRTFDCDIKRMYNGNYVSTSPSPALYDAIDWYFKMLGGCVGKEPRGLCAMAWSGIRSETNPSTTRYSDSLKQRLDHGLFKDQYGILIPILKEGIKFEEK